MFKVGQSLGAMLDQSNPNIFDAPRIQEAWLMGLWVKEIEIQLIQWGLGVCHARVELVRQVLHEAHGKASKVVLDEVAHDEAMLDEATHREVARLC